MTLTKIAKPRENQEVLPVVMVRNTSEFSDNTAHEAASDKAKLSEVWEGVERARSEL